MMIILYVDDAGITCQHKRDADLLISRLTASGFELTREGTFSEYLGIKFDQNKTTGAIHLNSKRIDS